MEGNTTVINVKKEKIKLVVLVVSILMIASSVTYAFFVAGVSDPANTDVNLGTEVSGGLVFTPGTPINLTANLTNFAEGDGSLSGETTSTANLKAASSTGSATENYYIYYNVTSNNFVYTKDNTTPELLLTITDPEGNEITALTNHPELTHKTVTDAVIGNVSGFDVTTYEGLILIDDSYTISTTDSTVGTTQEWKAKLTFVNLDTIQTANEGKVFESQLVLRSDEMLFPIYDAILDHNGGVDEIEAKTIPNFTQMATTNEGMFATQDDYGTSYYYRGAVDNNWVYFAGFYWRIIRINGNGSIRMIYSGTEAPVELDKVQKINNLSDIDFLKFNDADRFSVSENKAELVGYMYELYNRQGTSISSDVKTILDQWYQTNIFNTEYNSMISDSLFCNDRSVSSGVGYGDNATQFGYSNRYNKTPILTCPEKADAFNVADVNNGNGALEYPIGLITADETYFAGANSNTSYLKTGETFWTMTPYIYINLKYPYADEQKMIMINNNGVIDFKIMNSSSGIRPVLSINSNSMVSGNGTWNEPYVVK